MKARRAAPWRDCLSSDDEAEVAKWIAQLGLGRVARIISALADATGERGRTVQPDSRLMLDMAALKARNRSRGTHSIATEVVRAKRVAGRPATLDDSLVAKLRDEFNERQHAWLWLVNCKAPNEMEMNGRNMAPSPLQTRTLGRLIEMLPEELNVYGALLKEAKELGSDRLELVNKCGRKACERFLEERLREQIDNPFLPKDRPIPRSFFDLVADDLEAHAAAQEGRK